MAGQWQWRSVSDIAGVPGGHGGQMAMACSFQCYGGVQRCARQMVMDVQLMVFQGAVEGVWEANSNATQLLALQGGMQGA